MPVHIDRIETEIEITPAGTPPAATAAPSAAQPSKVSMHEAVLAVLEAELEDYLRMRG